MAERFYELVVKVLQAQQVTENITLVEIMSTTCISKQFNVFGEIALFKVILPIRKRI
jgi:hypothetical protein